MWLKCCNREVQCCCCLALAYVIIQQYQSNLCTWLVYNIKCVLFSFELLICTIVFSEGALIFGCTVALCFLIRDLMFYVIGEFTVCCLGGYTGPGMAAT